LNIAITAGARTTYETYLNTDTNGQPSPFDAADGTHVDQRFRGLIYVMAQNPAYAVR
jgi:hypothetical protein